MSPKTSPAPDRRSDRTWSLDDRRGRDALARLGLVDDRPSARDPRDRLTELGLGDSPDRPLGPRGLDAPWATRRIL